MNISQRAKIMIAAIAIVGAVSVGSNAFTAGGLTNPNEAGQSFVGGTTEQEITGAVIDSIVYSYNGLATEVDSLTVKLQGDMEANQLTATFAGVGGQTEVCDAGVYDDVSLTSFACDFTGQPTAAIGNLTLKVVPNP